MRTVVFVAPFFLETTIRFIRALVSLDDVRLAVVSQDPEDRLPRAVKERLVAHYRIDSGLDPDLIARAVTIIARERGEVTRLLGTLEELQVPLGVVRERLSIEGMGAAVADNFRDKERMKSALDAASLPCARHRLVRDAGETLEFARKVGYPLIVKPPAGAGARNTFRVDDASQLGEILARMPPSLARPALCEEFLKGEELSFDSVCIDGKLVWSSINHYRPSPLHVLNEPWIQWCVLLPREVDDARYDGIRAIAGRALVALGMKTGLSHMEWFLREDGTPAISEVGARPPGAQFMSLISYAHDVDFYRAWARLAVSGEFLPPGRPYAAGAAYLRGQGHGRVKAVHGLDEAQRELGNLVVESRLPRIGATHATGYEGDGFVILRHPETRVVEDGLQRLVRLVRVELE